MMIVIITIGFQAQMTYLVGDITMDHYVCRLVLSAVITMLDVLVLHLASERDIMPNTCFEKVDISPITGEI